MRRSSWFPEREQGGVLLQFSNQHKHPAWYPASTTMASSISSLITLGLENHWFQHQTPKTPQSRALSTSAFHCLLTLSHKQQLLFSELTTLGISAPFLLLLLLLHNKKSTNLAYFDLNISERYHHESWHLKEIQENKKEVLSHSLKNSTSKQVVTRKWPDTWTLYLEHSSQDLFLGHNPSSAEASAQFLLCVSPSFQNPRKIWFPLQSLSDWAWNFHPGKTKTNTPHPQP